MPKSKNKRKNGKQVKHNANRRLERFEETPSGVSLQDLINVVAYQQYVEDGTIMADGAEVYIPTEVPVTVGEGEEKRQVGTAVQVPGRDELSVRITDHDMIQAISDPSSSYSISTEDQEQD